MEIINNLKTTTKILSYNKLIESWSEEMKYCRVKSELPIKSCILSMWELFNKKRDYLEMEYMDDYSLLTGYLASFFLPNVQRIRNILNKPKISELFKSIIERNKQITICDFGSGPLSGFVGLLLFLSDNNIDIKNKQIKLIAIEKSEKAYTAGLKILEGSLENHDNIKISRVNNLNLFNEKIDSFIAINVLNEIPVKNRFNYIKKIHTVLNYGGMYLSVEPGQDQYSKEMGILRDKFLDEFEDISIIQPCTHTENCPLSSRYNRSDWCRFEDNWDPPIEQKNIDKLSMINHSNLNYSYNAFYKGQKIIHNIKGIIVSDKIVISPKNNTYSKTLAWMSKNLITKKYRIIHGTEYQKYLLCSTDGRLLSIYYNSDYNIKLKRGYAINTFDNAVAVCVEKLNPSKE